MGIFDSIGNIASSFLGYKSQQKTNESNQALMREQMQWSEDMWNKTNEYNTPAQQVERMKAAGLNPVSTQMANGTSIDGAGSSGGPPSSYQMIPNVDPMQSAGNFAHSFADASSLMQDAILKRDTRKAKVAEAERSVQLLEKSIENMDLDNKTKDIALSFAAAERQAAIDESRSRISLNRSQQKLADKEFEKFTYEINNVLPQSIKESIARTSASESQAKLNAANFKLVTQEFENAILTAKEIEARTGREQAQTDLLSAQTGETNVREALGRKEIYKTEVETEVAKTNWRQLEKEYQFYVETYNNRVLQFANELKTSEKDLKSYWIRLILNGADSASKGVAAGALLKKAAKVAPK